MPAIKAGALVMLYGSLYVIVSHHKRAHVILAPIRRRRTKPHRADLKLETWPPCYVPCHQIKTVPLAELPKPHAEIDPKFLAAIKAAIKLEAATQAAENAYQPVRDHTARGLNNIYHERE